MPKQIYNIRAYSPTGQLLRVLADYQSARYKLAENEVGDWDITVPWGDGTLPALLSPPNCIEFWRDGVFVFGGIVRRQDITQQGKTAFYKASGPSYLQWLVDTKMRPDGVVANGVSFGTSTTGTGDIVMSSADLLVMCENIVIAQVLDKNTQFLAANSGLLCGTVQAYTATAYNSVLETLQAMCKIPANMTFDITRDSDGLLRFHMFSPSRGPDRSKGTSSPVLFDLRGGNITDAEYYRDGNNVQNAVWGGGPGDKAARYIYPATEALTDAQSIADWGRIEGFIDVGSETTTNTDKKTADGLAASSQPEESVNFKITPFSRYTLGVDFDFGTKVTVVWGDILEYTGTIMGLETTLDSSSGVAQVDINVGDTITGSSATRASIYLGRFLRQLRSGINTQARH